MAEEAIAEEVVVDEVVAEAPLAAEEPAPFTGPLPPPPLAPSVQDVVAPESAVEERPPVKHAWDIDYGHEEAPVVEEAVVEEAVAEPVVQEAAPVPVIEDIVVEEPVAEVVAVEEPVAAASEPEIAEEPAPEPVAEAAPVVEELAPEPVVEPVAQEPAMVEEPVAVEEPAAAPAEEAPAPEPAAAREGGGIDQAEMRRRIEETRARLKAKAFDAMMSGEAALLSRDSGDRAVPTGEDHGLDEETDSAIDDSLSQEEY